VGLKSEEGQKKKQDIPTEESIQQVKQEPFDQDIDMDGHVTAVSIKDEALENTTDEASDTEEDKDEFLINPKFITLSKSITTKLGIFSGIIGYFDMYETPNDLDTKQTISNLLSPEIIFELCGGTVSPLIDDNVKYIFMDQSDLTRLPMIKNISFLLRREPKIITSSFIIQSKIGNLLKDPNDYLVK